MAKNRENGAEGAVLAKFWAFLPNGQPKFFPDNHIWVAGCPADNQQIFLIFRPVLKKIETWPSKHTLWKNPTFG